MKRATRTDRLNLRIPAALLVWAKKHAQRNNTTVTQIIIDHLTKVQREAQNG